MVTLRRTVGAKPDEDREEIDRILYVELRKAVLAELRDRVAFDKSLEYSVTALTKHCERVVKDGPEGSSAKRDEDFPHEGSERKLARKKTARRKTKKGRSKASRR
jgi:hypothetical protein